MMSGDSCPLEIEKVVQFAFRKGFYGSDKEFLIDVALTFSHPVNLTYRYSHSLGQLRQVAVPPRAQFENPCLQYHSYPHDAR